jgi:hypothetical protein
MLNDDRTVQKKDFLFDTLKFCKALKNGGFSNDEAEVLTEELADLLFYLTKFHFATKADIKEMDSLYVSKKVVRQKIKNIFSAILYFFKL